MSLLLQALINGLVSGALLAVPAIGFTAMFAVLRFPNFSVSGIATLGAFAGYVAYGAGLQIVGSLAVAFADRRRGRPVPRSRGAPCRWSSRARCRRPSPRSPRGWCWRTWCGSSSATTCAATTGRSRATCGIGDIRFSPQQLETMAVALAIMLAVFAALAFTRIGKAMRASADNPELAALKGIRPQRVAMMASFVGMGLVGVGGMLLGLDSSIDPLTGTRILLSIFAAAVLGGLGSAPGAVLGAFLIGIARGAVGAGGRLGLSRRGRLLRHPDRAQPPPARAAGRAGLLAMLNYLLFIATIGGIYGLLALSLNLIWGGAGMVNLGLAGFFAVGAYASALLTTTGHAPILAGWALALIVGGAAGLVVVLVDHAAARGLSRDRHAGLRRGRAAGRLQRDLADPRHRRHLGHSRPVARRARAAILQRGLPADPAASCCSRCSC